MLVLQHTTRECIRELRVNLAQLSKLPGVILAEPYKLHQQNL